MTAVYLKVLLLFSTLKSCALVEVVASTSGGDFFQGHGLPSLPALPANIATLPDQMGQKAQEARVAFEGWVKSWSGIQTIEWDDVFKRGFVIMLAFLGLLWIGEHVSRWIGG